MSKQDEVILSGIRPTGRLHYGNYFGAIQQFIELQEQGLRSLDTVVAHLESRACGTPTLGTPSAGSDFPMPIIPGRANPGGLFLVRLPGRIRCGRMRERRCGWAI